MEEKNKSICPACGSWNRETDKEYNVKHENRKRGLIGICLNPICKAEWTYKSPDQFPSTWEE